MRAQDAGVSNRHLQEYAIEIAVVLDKVENVIDHNRADAESPVRQQAAQRHDVQSPLVLRGVDAAAHRTDHNVIVVGQFGQLAGVQHIDVEAVVVGDWEHDRVQLFQLFDIVRCDIAQFDVFPAPSDSMEFNRVHA